MIMIRTYNIETLMQLRGFKRKKDLAEALQIAPSHMTRILKNQLVPTLTTLDKLCTALNCPIEHIIEWRPDEPDSPGPPDPEPDIHA